MNLTFGEIAEATPAVVKVMRSELIEDWEEALVIAELKKPFLEAEELLKAGKNAIAFKYAKKAEARKCDDLPTGYSTVEEKEQELEEQDAFNKKICTTIEFDFKPLKKKTVQALFKGKEGKEGKLTPEDLATLKKLGMLPTS